MASAISISSTCMPREQKGGACWRSKSPARFAKRSKKPGPLTVFHEALLKEDPFIHLAVLLPCCKGSIVITLALSFWLLGEPLTPKIALGCVLILAGIVTLTYR